MKKMPREIELKFEFNSANERALRRHLRRVCGGKRPVTEPLVSIYFDTPDLRLFAKGISLRVRRVGKRYRQTIKIAEGPATGLFDRAEWEQYIHGPKPDLALVKGDAFADLLNGRHPRSLRPIFETRVRRTKFNLTSHGQKIELALDQGEIDTGERRAPICELELELKRGERTSLFELAKALNDVIPLRLCVKAKAERGYELARNLINPIDKAADVHLSPDMTTQEAFRIIGNGCLRQLMANEPAMIAGDVEALHQMRVALRRLRAAISAFAIIVADSDWQKIRSELRWITGALGPVRDLDVFVAEVLIPLRSQNPNETGVLSIFRDFERRRATAHREAATAIQSARFCATVLDAAKWIEVGPWTKTDDDLMRLLREQPVPVHAANALQKRRRKLRRTGKTLKELSPRERHAVRIAAKKFRYAAEFFSDVFPEKAAAKRCKDALSALKDLQDALGGLNDITVREQLASNIALSPRLKSNTLQARHRAFAAGVIFGSQEAHVAELLEAAQRAYESFLKVRPFWK